MGIFLRDAETSTYLNSVQALYMPMNWTHIGIMLSKK